ncbi:formyltransferase family protein [Eggerthella lenta]|uniref:formyltransferase family protein n=1 Tax=Eggerthella lenta TaxID=84112 RepID=UPI0022E78BC0|nr:formyltransferase family protein [Eggerthella lenta]
MRSVFFTKPKKLTEEMLGFMLDQGEDVLAVVVSGKAQYADSGLFRMCDEAGADIVDYDDCDAFFRDHDGEIDMIWCCTFPKIVKGEWLCSASTAAVNFHPAPLPDYRGAFLYNFAILNGEEEYGVTAHLMSERFDEGALIEVDRFPFDCANRPLSELVSVSEGRLLELAKRTYLRFVSGEEVRAIPQDPASGAYYSRKLFEESKRVRLDEDPEAIERRIRAFWIPPHEGAYVEIGGERFYLATKEMLDGLR